jgi:hypothetical protein
MLLAHMLGKGARLAEILLVGLAVEGERLIFVRLAELDRGQAKFSLEGFLGILVVV